MRILEKAEGAPNLASSLNMGAFNLGNAGGTWIGELVIDHGWGYPSLGWVAAVITVDRNYIALYSLKPRRYPGLCFVLFFPFCH